jgi:hypothetical protein
MYEDELEVDELFWIFNVAEDAIDSDVEDEFFPFKIVRLS